MNPSPTASPPSIASSLESSRLDYLDATRAFALVLGVVFHASLSFSPIFMGWAVQDISTSPLVGIFISVSHSFRMETFFLIAGFLGHVTLHRKGAGEFVRTRALRIVMPLVVGWFIFRPLLVSGWVMGAASLRGDYDFGVGLKEGVNSLGNLPDGIFTGSHLWFLYYLTLITGLTLVVRGLLKLTGALHGALSRWADACVAWLANSGLALPVLIAPTAAVLWFMRHWGMDTPDQSLQPHLPALMVYGGFFLLGWLLGRQCELIAPLTLLTVLRVALAAGSTAAIYYLGRFQFDPAHPNHTAAHVAFVLSYALTMWSLVFLTIGLFRKYCTGPRPWIRYIADSSYWMYLMHLPIVVWLQVAVAEVEVHWSFKLAGISVLTVALALLSYDLFVRSTWVGWFLNGRKKDRVLAPFILDGFRSAQRSGP